MRIAGEGGSVVIIGKYHRRSRRVRRGTKRRKHAPPQPPGVTDIGPATCAKSLIFAGQWAEPLSDVDGMHLLHPPQPKFPR